MTRRLAPRVGRQMWWWVFGLGIALPAMTLAVLGLRAIRSEEAGRLAAEQAQLVPLADSAMANAFDGLIARATSAATAGHPDALPDDAIPFDAHDNDVLAFPRDRLYFGSFDKVPDEVRPPVLTTDIEARIEDAAQDEAQHREQDARTIYATLRAQPELTAWAEMRIALLAMRAGDSEALKILVNPQWADLDARSPAGFPLAVVAASYSDGLSTRDRARFLPLLERTRASIRTGRWWLSAAARRAYDVEIERLVSQAGGRPAIVSDDRLDRLERLATALAPLAERRAPASRAELFAYDGARGLIVWSTQEGTAHVRRGAVATGVAVQEIFDQALAPLLSKRRANATVRDPNGTAVWGDLGGLSEASAQPLTQLPGWQVVFSVPSAGRGGSSADLRYVAVLVPFIMLAFGLVVTFWIVRREMALARLQSDFVASVTHEFKSPLTSITLLMERLTAGRPSSEASRARYFTAIQAETTRLSTLVDRLLDAQQLQSGRKRHVARAVSLDALVRATVERLRAIADARQTTIDVEVSGAVPQLDLDEQAVGDAVANLVDNAVKYSPAGSRVSVCVRAVDADGAVHVDVIDEGMGVAPGEAGRIFEPFYRSQHGNRENVRGTGLGLALVKATMDAHGGSVQVAPNGARGSRFRLTFPSSHMVDVALSGDAVAAAPTHDPLEDHG